MAEYGDVELDNTCLIDMKKQFNRYLSTDDATKKRRRENDDMSLVDPAGNTSSFLHDSDTLRQKTELVFNKSRVSMLETQLQRKKDEIDELKILHQREIENLTSKHDRELRGYYVLQKSHKRVQQREEEREDELRDAKDSRKQLEIIYNEKFQQLQRKNIDLDREYTQLLDEQKSKNRELRNQILSLQADLSISEGENLQRKQQLAELNRSNRQEADLDLKSKVDELEDKISTLETERQQYADNQVILAARKDDLKRLDKLKEENATMSKKIHYLKMTAENSELLKEKITTLERQLENFNKCKDDAAYLRIEKQTLENQLVQLQQKMIPADTADRLKESQTRELIITEESNSLKSTNRQLGTQILKLETTSTNQYNQINEQTAELKKLQTQIDKLRRKIILLSKENQGYKNIIQSSEAEITREVVPHARDLNLLQSAIELYKQDIDNLEKELSARDQTIKQLQQQTSVPASDTPSKRSAADEMDEKLVFRLREEIVRLEKRIEELEHEREVNEAWKDKKDIQGEYDPTKTKVLHFAMNPADNSQKARALQLKTLQDENKKLRERLKLVEKRLADAHDLTQQVELNVNKTGAMDSLKIKEYKDKIANLEQRYQKMLDMFKQNTTEFRSTVYKLTGFRIDVAKSKEYKLMSMYASSPDDYLLFHDDEGDLQLLETDYATTLTHLCEEYLDGQRSIPAFLSALTLDLFKQQTMMTTMMTTMM